MIITYEAALAKRRSNAAKRAAKSRAIHKLYCAYSERFGGFSIGLDDPVLKRMEKALKTGVDHPLLVKARVEEAEQRREFRREMRKHARKETKRRAALNAPLLAPITPEKERAYTRLIKTNKLYEGACDLSWPEYFVFREAHPECEPLTDDDLAYAGQWTSCAVPS